MEFLQFLLTLVVFVLIVSLLVSVHELGHFLAAKLVGIKVEEFAIGFGPRLWAKKYGETEYRFNLLPLGGFVKLKGERNNPAAGKDSFSSKPLWAKTVVLLAGIGMNLLLAILVGSLYLNINNFRVVLQNAAEYDFVGVSHSVDYPNLLLVSEVLPDSPAEGKLFAEDIIIAVDGEKVRSTTHFQELLDLREGQKLILTTFDLASMATKDISLTLNERVSEEDLLLGVAYTETSFGIYVLDYDPNLFSGINYALNTFGYQMKLLSSSFNQAVDESDAGVVIDDLAGLVEVGVAIDQILRSQQVQELLNLIVIISVALAFFNILPIPILDGGQLIIEIVERIYGKKLDDRIIQALSYAGLGILLALVVLVNWKDIIQFSVFDGLFSWINSVLGRV